MQHFTNTLRSFFFALVIRSCTRHHRSGFCGAFHPIKLSLPSSFATGKLVHHSKKSLFELSLQKGWLENDTEDDDSLVTREDLNRDMLGLEPKVKRKNRKGRGYKPLDNRDHLPFSVRTKTPDDPYKTRYQKKKEEQSNKKTNRHRRKKTDLDLHLSAAKSHSSLTSKMSDGRSKKNTNRLTDASTAPSRLIEKQKKKKSSENHDDSVTTVLGEFELDKSTTSGDVIMLGNKEYRVETARCQYKYAGGQRFVMVRKILEVKELTRVADEKALLRQFNSSPPPSSGFLEEFE